MKDLRIVAYELQNCLSRHEVCLELAKAFKVKYGDKFFVLDKQGNLFQVIKFKYLPITEDYCIVLYSYDAQCEVYFSVDAFERKTSIGEFKVTN